MKAYVSVLSTESFAPGVLVLWESLKLTKPEHDFYLLVSKGVGADCEQTLRALGINVLRDDSDLLGEVGFSDPTHRWRHTFDKLKIFNLTEFEKIVYLDADMYVCRNLDGLFHRPHMSAVETRDPEDWLDGRKYFNSGLMVVEPSREQFDELTGLIGPTLARCAAAGIPCGDQNVLNLYAQNWPDVESLHLDDGFNVFWGSIDSYVREQNYTLRSAKDQARPVYVIHFTGKLKPWHATASYIVKTVGRPIRQGRLPSSEVIGVLWKYRSILRTFNQHL